MGYRDTDSFMVDLKAYDIYKGIEKDVEIRFDTSNHELERALPKGRNKKVIWLMKDKLCGKTPDTKKCVIKRKLEFETYKNCLKATHVENKINHLHKNIIDINSFTEL